jgi:hypothetical protein
LALRLRWSLCFTEYSGVPPCALSFSRACSPSQNTARISSEKRASQAGESGLSRSTR